MQLPVTRSCPATAGEAQTRMPGTTQAQARTGTGTGTTVIIIIAGKLFDPCTERLLTNQVITVDKDSGLVVDVSPAAHDSEGWDQSRDLRSASGEVEAEVIDLSRLTVLPGFVDAHVHFFLHPYSETPWEDQLTKEPLAERVVRATVHARRTLMAGFTAVRDLGTEGADDADVALRKCFSGGGQHGEALIPGPRYFCASRAIAPTGSYGPKSMIHVNREGIDGVTGAEVADGREECIKAVRRQIGAGADWIKIYADYRFRSRIFVVSTEPGRASISTFNDDELKALIETAHQYGVKVAAHATNQETIGRLLELGVDTIEHGYDLVSSGGASGSRGRSPGDPQGRDTLRALAQSTTKWVPTLAAYYTMGQGSGGTWERAANAFKAALEEGMDNIACGGDTGVFPHGENALEMSLMVRLGADWRKVLRWGTFGGWETIRSMAWEGPRGQARLAALDDLQEAAKRVGENEVPFGVVRRGFAADLIATTGDFATDFEGAVSAESVSFVMKGGRVYKRDGVAVV